MFPFNPVLFVSVKDASINLVKYKFVEGNATFFSFNDESFQI